MSINSRFDLPPRPDINENVKTSIPAVNKVTNRRQLSVSLDNDAANKKELLKNTVAEEKTRQQLVEFRLGDHVNVGLEGTIEYGWTVASPIGPKGTIEVIKHNEDGKTLHELVSVSALSALNQPADPEQLSSVSPSELPIFLTRVRDVMHLNGRRYYGWQLAAAVGRVLAGKEDPRSVPNVYGLQNVLRRS